MNTPDADQTTSPTPKPVIYQMLPRLLPTAAPTLFPAAPWSGTAPESSTT